MLLVYKFCAGYTEVRLTVIDYETDERETLELSLNN